MASYTHTLTLTPSPSPSFGRFVRCCSRIVESSSLRCHRISPDSISILDSISSSLNLEFCRACSIRVMDCIRSCRLMTMIPVLISSRHVPMFPLIIFRLILTRFPNLNFADCKPLCAVACFPPLRVNVSIRKFSPNFLFRIDDFSGYSDWFPIEQPLILPSFASSIQWWQKKNRSRHQNVRG